MFVQISGANSVPRGQFTYETLEKSVKVIGLVAWA